MAYYVIAQEQFKNAGDQGKGMGDAVGYYKATATAFEKARKVVVLIPANY